MIRIAISDSGMSAVLDMTVLNQIKDDDRRRVAIENIASAISSVEDIRESADILNEGVEIK